MAKTLIIFDTGTGGHIFTSHLKKTFPTLEIKNVTDTKNTPYGTKTPQEIQRYTEQSLKPYLNNSKNIILIACNTATAYSIDLLREKYPNTFFIGTEPTLKSVSDQILNKSSKNDTILVLATPATLKSPRYQALKEEYLEDQTVLEPDCSAWASAIDADTFNQSLIKTTLAPYSDQPFDYIVLGCTHYLKIKPLLSNLFPQATLSDPLTPITNHLKSLLPPE